MSTPFCQNCMLNFVSNPKQLNFRMFKDFNKKPCERLIAPLTICAETSLYSVDEPLPEP